MTTHQEVALTSGTIRTLDLGVAGQPQRG